MITTFGEIMMRLNAPGHRRFEQTDRLDISYGGGEANVAAALARMGVPAAHVTVFPDNDLGHAAASFFRNAGVDDTHFYFSEGRLGLYFMETGASMRPSRVVYDRYDSAFARLNPAVFDWKDILKDTRWVHWTGITPAISAAAAQACGEALRAAQELGILVSADVNYRRVLWKYGKKPGEVMPDLVACCDVIVCTEGDALDIFGIESNGFQDMAEQMMHRFPNLKKIIATRRETLSANHNKLTGRCFDGQKMRESITFDIHPIVDRIGAGDAFIAGYIFGALHFGEEEDKVLAFATAAAALKHTIEGDFNRVTEAEVWQMIQGDRSGRLLR